MKIKSPPADSRLTILPETMENGKRGSKFCKARCTCGNIIRTSYYHILNGHVKSCGCLLKEYYAKNDASIPTNSPNRIKNLQNKRTPNSQNKLHIRNIFYLPDREIYRVNIQRNKKTVIKEARTLKDAIRIKERLLRDYENGLW